MSERHTVEVLDHVSWAMFCPLKKRMNCTSICHILFMLFYLKTLIVKFIWFHGFCVPEFSSCFRFPWLLVCPGLFLKLLTEFTVSSLVPCYPCVYIVLCLCLEFSVVVFAKLYGLCLFSPRVDYLFCLFNKTAATRSKPQLFPATSMTLSSTDSFSSSSMLPCLRSVLLVLCLLHQMISVIEAQNILVPSLHPGTLL